ncbi:MAG: gluconate 2-dehydrogenase subunit 3 family protein [Chitinophagaceae bacterium]
MDRRKLIKQFCFAGAGIILLPACVQNNTKPSIVLKNLLVTGEQERMLAELSATIIPATDTPGCKEIAAHLFVLKMVDDCYSKADQQKFIQGFDHFEKACATFSGHRFINCTLQRRILFLKNIETGARQDLPERFFYGVVKKLSIQAYTTSEFYLTNVVHYKLIPGTYRGCVPATNLI